MKQYIKAIRKVTHYSEKLIRQTIEMGDKGIEPLRLPGSMQWDIWIIYQGIREYERISESKPVA